MEGLIKECAVNKDINLDWKLAATKRHADHIVQEFYKHCEVIKRRLTEENPDIFKAISIDYRKREKVDNMERAIRERKEKLFELEQKVDLLRKSVPEKLIENKKF